MRAKNAVRRERGFSDRVEVSEPSEFGVWLVGVGPEVHGSDGNSPFPRYSGLMNAQRPQFDSHRFVKRLTTAGLSEEVAEILADEHTRLIIPDDVATKADVETVSANLDFTRAEMATKADLVAVSANLDFTRAEMATKADVETVSANLDFARAEMATKVDLEAVRAEMATKADVEAVRAEMATKADVEAIRAEMATKADVEAIRAEMATKADLHREIAASEARMEQRLQNAILEAKISLIKWMIATMAVFSGIVIGAMTAFQ